MKVKYYIVVNKEGEAYAGMVQGSLTWTPNWDLAKKLQRENTTALLAHNTKAELLEL